MKIENVPQEINDRLDDLIEMADAFNNSCNGMYIDRIVVWYGVGTFPRVYQFRMWKDGEAFESKLPLIDFGTTPPYTPVHRIVLELKNSAWGVTDLW